MIWQMETSHHMLLFGRSYLLELTMRINLCILWRYDIYVLNRLPDSAIMTSYCDWLAGDGF
jgi:hypothetical protein